MAIGLGVHSGGSHLLLRCSSFGSLKAALSSLGNSTKTTTSLVSSASFHTGTRSGVQSLRQWQNETPPGGLTEVYVYRPQAKTVWPDEKLGPTFSHVDPRCCLPGNTGTAESFHASTLPSTTPGGGLANSASQFIQLQSDILTRYTQKEHQAQTLYSANDYIQHTEHAERYVCADPGVLETFPELDGMRRLNCELHEAPTLLKREVSGLFPDRDVISKNLSVITLSQRTTNDMTGWSNDIEQEREAVIEHFVSAAKELCGRLKNEGYWSDFIDPSSGKPYYGQYTNTTMFETDEKYRLLGFRIEDLGCCKVISHREFGRNVFVGTIFTDAHPSSGVVQDMFSDMRVVLGAKTSQKTDESITTSTTTPATTVKPELASSLLPDSDGRNGGGK